MAATPCALLLLTGAACDRNAPAPPLPPLPADATAAVEALLARWHGGLRQTLDRVTVEMRAGDQNGPLRKVDTDGRRMRVRAGDGATELLREDGAWRWRDGEAATSLADGDRRALDDLRDLIGAAYLVPLYAVKSIARQGPTVFAVAARDGTTWRLEIDAQKQLPVCISGPPGEVRFATFFSTGVSELPAGVELGRFGKQHLTLIAAGVLANDFLFAAPAATGAAVPQPSAPVLRRGADEPLRPVVMQLAERPFLVLDDPGAWDLRAERIATTYATLAAQGQVEDGLPFLFEEEGARKLGVPFGPDESQGSKPLVARPDQLVRRRPHQQAIVLYRAKESFASSVAAGAQAVRNHAVTAQLEVTEALRVVPILDWHALAATAVEPAAVKLRFELPVAARK